MYSPKALVDPNFINITPDLVIVGKEAHYRAHRIAFLCLSPYFQTIFRHNCHPDSNGCYRLDMKDVSDSVLNQILSYASYGRADVNGNNVIELLIAGDKYNIKAIIEICDRFLQINLDEDNYLETFLLSHYYNCEDLKKFTTTYILSNDLIATNEQEQISVDTVMDLWRQRSDKLNQIDSEES